MSKKKQKFYTVWKGRETGVFPSWEECKLQVSGFDGAQYKSFDSEEEAKRASRQNYWSVVGERGDKKNAVSSGENGSFTPKNIESLAVDAACSGNPGVMEYRGVYSRTGEQIFYQGPFRQGTNNIGEFLALVHGLALLKQQGSSIPIYSDSVSAISWVKAKKCKTKLEENDENHDLFELIDRAETWLRENDYTTQILKWNTKAWGEIPADFGRK
ncbi:MAG: ribonuclease H family protein [Prevotellaceae bacterium]|jgi:ribonuclease HI|nr:ribonuclease H family protein [Prevotellaceae bacterium]